MTIKYKVLLLIGCLLATSAVCFANEPQATKDERMMAKLYLTYNKLSTLSVKIDGNMVVKMDDTTINVVYNSTAKIKQGGKYSINTKAKFMNNDFSGAVVSDGKTIWDADSDNFKYAVLTMKNVTDKEPFISFIMDRIGADVTTSFIINPDSPNMFNLTKNQLKSLNIKDYPLSKVDGKKIYVLIHWLDPKNKSAGKVTFHLDPKTFLVQRCIYEMPLGDKGGTIVYTMNYSEYVVNKPISDDEFQYKPSALWEKTESVTGVFTRMFE